MISSGKKRYLIAIYELSPEGKSIRSIDIANALNVKRPTVFRMLEMMSKENLVVKDSYGAVRLTAEGIKIAGRLYSTYLLANKFFIDHIGSNQENAKNDAMILSLSISDENMESIAKRVLSTPGTGL